MYQNRNSQLVDRFEDWWNRNNRGLPLMDVVAIKENAKWQVKPPANPVDRYLDPEYLIARAREIAENCYFLADSYANISADIGPGSLAVYLGAIPQFAEDTVWYSPCLFSAEQQSKLQFNPQNAWWQRHLSVLQRLREEVGGAFLINIPDLIENLDTYAAMRGTQNALFDLMDAPESVQRAVEQIDDVYFRYYDTVLDIVKNPDGVASYTCFQILGKGRIAKIQCDFSAMISPGQFRQFVLPSLQKQVKRLDHALYHLDGPDAIRHVLALMELEGLDALQWTCGAGQPDGACTRWYPIYDQVTAAGKGLWVQIYDGNVENWIRSAEQLMNKYGKKIFYFHFPWMSQTDADILMNYAQKHWAN